MVNWLLSNNLEAFVNMENTACSGSGDEHRKETAAQRVRRCSSDLLVKL